MAEVELGATPFWVLLMAGALSSLGSIWAFRQFGDVARLRTAANGMLAHLLEFRLFADEPLLILRAQRDLVIANARMLRAAAVPSLVLLLPYAMLLAVCDAYFGHAPLRPGEATVVTVRCAGPSTSEPDASALTALQLRTPVGMRVETPPVRVRSEKEVSWRVRPVVSSAGELELIDSRRAVSKTICAQPGLQWLSAERTRPIRFFAHPLERPLTDAAFLSIRVEYPAATIFRVHWLVWFAAGSLAGALFTVLPRMRLF